MKKAQITLFIIIGVVALFMAGFMLYYVGLNTKRPAPGYEDVTQVTTYVNACIDKLADEALLIAGQQSGIIFVSQGGTYPDFQYVYEDLFYNLGKKKKNEGNPARSKKKGTEKEKEHVEPGEDEIVIPSSIISPGQGRPPAGAAIEIPEYPRKYYPYDQSLNKKSYMGYFGINVLRKLNAEEDALSIQSQMESYITKKLRGCTNFQGTQAFPEYSVEETGEIKTEITFAETDTVIKVSYPLKITKKSGGITTANDFLVRKKVRMKRIYEVANYLINRDISDVTFDIANSEEEQNKGLWGMQIERTPIDAAENVGTFITIIDPESEIKGVPYTFTFTRQNRNPALDFIVVSDLRNLPNGCSFDDANSVVECAFIDQHHCVPCDKGSCCSCPHDYFSPDPFSVTRNMFPEIAYDPDEDRAVSGGTEMTANSFSYSPVLTSYPGTYGSYHITVKAEVYDSNLKDWQQITFNIDWSDRRGC